MSAPIIFLPCISHLSGCSPPFLCQLPHSLSALPPRKNLSRESYHSSSVSCSRAICVDLCCCGMQCISFSHLNNLFVALSNTFCAFFCRVVALLHFQLPFVPAHICCIKFYVFRLSQHFVPVLSSICSRQQRNMPRSLEQRARLSQPLHRLEDIRRDEIQIRYYCPHWAGHHRREIMRFFRIHRSFAFPYNSTQGAL